ncbi:MAG: hypothetical protein O7C60_01385 [Rickettsia endosymbiont of Ixodes persulcatus]|nr:hypothetical protein [Rickettsia endosymbiont of Ixodes persulcatus]MCZ6919103.1 hypothetical protein [Rickettsia endosymbiont of Ixodes persulcatus]
MFSIGSAVVMTKHGKDIFANKYDTEKLTKSIGLTTEFFDNNKSNSWFDYCL